MAAPSGGTNWGEGGAGEGVGVGMSMGVGVGVGVGGQPGMKLGGGRGPAVLRPHGRPPQALTASTALRLRARQTCPLLADPHPQQGPTCVASPSTTVTLLQPFSLTLRRACSVFYKGTAISGAMNSHSKPGLVLTRLRGASPPPPSQPTMHAADLQTSGPANGPPTTLAHAHTCSQSGPQRSTM